MWIIILFLTLKNTVCMYLNSKRYKHLVKPSLYLNGAPICYVDKEKYLGFIINSLSKHDDDILKANSISVL